MKRIVSCVAMAFVLAACSDRASESAHDATDIASATATKGPVTATIALTPKAPRLSDEPTLVLTIEAAANVDVVLPPFPATLGGFTVRDFHELPAQVRDSKRTTIRTWTLEPSESGRHVIPSFALACTDSSAGTEHAAFTVDTPELAVEVTTVFAGAAPSLDQLRGPGAPLGVSRRFKPWPWILGGAAALAIIALVVWLVRARRARAAAPIVLTPRELAAREFAALARAGFLARGDLAGFYVELTAVVRRYIERTTSIKAPEQTTPEFLRAMRGHPAFAADQQSRLKAFLEAADLVKFAAVRPDRGAVVESFKRAQEFVGQDESGTAEISSAAIQLEDAA